MISNKGVIMRKRIVSSKRIMNKKAILPRHLVAIIIAIAVMLFLLLLLSGDARAMARNLIGLGASDDTVWKQNCVNACDFAKPAVTDCLKDNAEWNRLYCSQAYNDSMTCAQAEAEIALSKCEHKTGVDTCVCAA